MMAGWVANCDRSCLAKRLLFALARKYGGISVPRTFLDVTPVDADVDLEIDDDTGDLMVKVKGNEGAKHDPH